MNTLFTFMRYDMFFLIGGLTLIVGFRLVTRQINTDGLLRDKTSGSFSPGRLQMLLVTLVIAIYYVTMVIEKDEFPTLPREYFLVLGGSHLFYLGGKSYGIIARKLELAATRIAGRMDE